MAKNLPLNATKRANTPTRPFVVEVGGSGRGETVPLMDKEEKNEQD